MRGCTEACMCDVWLGSMPCAVGLCRQHGWGQQWGWAGSMAGDSSGDGALTRKLLSLGLVARLRPRRMLSFLSDTLDRVTLPETEARCSVTPALACPLPRVCCSESLEGSPYPLECLEDSTDLP